jgi:SAM-dependent methyltransferase
MKVQVIPGIKGYDGGEARFIAATISLDFQTLYHDFLPFIPSQPARILDLGAGIGKDVYEFAGMGHTVTAVEPLDSFREEGQKRYLSTAIEWIDDGLPLLNKLEERAGCFDFILASGVWHHLDKHEQDAALLKIATLLSPGGIFAFSLRNGPAGLGTHVFPTNAAQTILQAKQYGLYCLLHLADQPSMMADKDKVVWAKLVLQKQG